MRIRNKKVEKLVEKYREISLLGKVSAVLGWDLNVNLPPKGSEGRAAQTAYLTALIADKWLDREFRKLLEEVNKTKPTLNLEEKAIVRNLNYRGKLYFKVPKEIIVELSETSSKAFMVWKEAKKNDKFKDFEPHLRKVIKLNQIIAEHLGYKDNKYDALLDLYEPGLTAKFCKKIFGKLQPELTRTLKKISAKGGQAKEQKLESLVGGEVAYPEQDQKQVAFFVLRRMGYDLEAGRMDVSPHPFTETLGRQDVRLTTRYHENDFRASFAAAMHEAGHGLYEQGIDEEYDSTPLEGGVSLGIHESQSRFWENQLGRSYEFIKFITPIFHAFYAEQLSKVSTDTLYALFNQVKQ
ncbi:carboxypeptidase M32, partial [Patescibacteria group bacterium]|nr:carboxypeptidase M32 [Patescibacteria group bacterium]